MMKFIVSFVAISVDYVHCGIFHLCRRKLFTRQRGHTAVLNDNGTVEMEEMSLDLTKENKALTEENQRLKRTLQETEQQKGELENENQKLKQTLQETQQQRQQLENEKPNLNEKIQHLEQTKSDLEQRIHEKQQEDQQLEEKNRVLEERVQSVKLGAELDCLKRKCEALEKEVKDKNRRIDSMQKEKDKLKDELSDRRAELAQVIMVYLIWQ